MQCCNSLKLNCWCVEHPNYDKNVLNITKHFKKRLSNFSRNFETIKRSVVATCHFEIFDHND